LSTKLNQKLGLPEEELASAKRKSAVVSPESRDSKKPKTEAESPIEEKPPADAMDLTKTEKVREKSLSIMSTVQERRSHESY